MAAPRDFYDLLGVKRDATADEIQRAYRKLARTYHPDVNKEPSAEERFKEISEAYDVLSDPDTRRRYDAFGHDFRQIPEGVDPAAYARARSGDARRRAPDQGDSGGVWYSRDFGDDIEVEDLFGSFFRERGRGRGWGRVQGADQEVELPVSVEEAFRGGQRTIALTAADGERTLTVTIPPGVVDGQRIRLAGQGGQGTGGAAPGDLHLIVRLAPHPHYRVRGRDIYVTLPLSPWEAALGTSVAIDTPGGEAKVRVPPGTSSGKQLRLKGRGLPNPRGAAGHLFAEVRIMVPKTLTETERDLFEQLAAVSTFDPRRER
jgi:curved DNA-binding protein